MTSSSLHGSRDLDASQEFGTIGKTPPLVPKLHQEVYWPSAPAFVPKGSDLRIEHIDSGNDGESSQSVD